MSNNGNEKELNIEEEVKGVGTYVFKKPTKIDGEEVKEIAYDLNLLNGKSIRNARSELGKRGYAVVLKEFDEVYNAALFAEASGLTFDNVECF